MPEAICTKLTLLGYSIRNLIMAVVGGARATPETRGMTTNAQLADATTYLPRMLDYFGMLEGTGFASVAVYDITLIYDTLVRALLDVLQIPLESHGDEPTGATVRRRSNRVRAQHTRPRSSFAKLPTELSMDLVKLLELLRAEHKAHNDIFEGFLSRFLAQIGYSLRWATWGSEGSMATQNSDRVSGSLKSPDDSSMERQVPYLIWLLDEILKIAARFPCFTATGQDASLRSGSVTQEHQCRLSKAALQKLQNTMLLAVFGEKTAGENTPGLRSRSTPPKMCKPLDAPNEPDARSLLKKEVWKLLGWDILHSLRDGGE